MAFSKPITDLVQRRMVEGFACRFLDQNGDLKPQEDVDELLLRHGEWATCPSPHNAYLQKQLEIVLQQDSKALRRRVMHLCDERGCDGR